jgi:alpha-glucuronidase
MVTLKVYEDTVQYTKVVKSTNADGLGHLDCYRENGGIDTYDGISDFSGYVITNETERRRICGTGAERLDRLAAENKLLKAQVQAQTNGLTFWRTALLKWRAGL